MSGSSGGGTGGGGGGGGGGGSDDGGGDTPIRPTPRPPGGGGGGGPGGDPDPCAIDEITNLNSPVRAVTAGLSPGQILDVRFDPGPPRLLLAETSPGVVAGSITSPSFPQIISCIANGAKYVAEVLSVRGAAVQIRITRQ